MMGVAVPKKASKDALIEALKAKVDSVQEEEEEDDDDEDDDEEEEEEEPPPKAKRSRAK